MNNLPNQSAHLAPAKPPYGSPCNNCGVCCIAIQCPLSLAIFGEHETCPALEFLGHGKGFGCGLIRDTADYVPDLTEWGGEVLTEAFALMIGAGVGCDGTLNGEKRSPFARKMIRSKAEANIAQASEGARMLVEYFRQP